MKGRILIIDGPPDPTGAHLVHELAAFYREGAKQGGHAAAVAYLRDFGDHWPLATGGTAPSHSGPLSRDGRGA